MFLPPEEIRDVNELPIFVWDDVLLPFVTLSGAIHVADPKYAQMLEDIALGNRLFGVSPKYLRNPDIGLPYVNSTGCIAQLLECHTFASGDSNIKIEGLARYRIVKYLETDKPYPVAEIKFFEEENERYHHPVRLEEVRSRAGELEEITGNTCLTAQRVLQKIYLALGKNAADVPLMRPTDPVKFSFLISTLFRFDADDRLHILQSPCPIHRLKFAIEWLEEFEEGIDDNLKRHKLIDPFLKLPNNKNNPDLS